MVLVATHADAAMTRTVTAGGALLLSWTVADGAQLEQRLVQNYRFSKARVT